MTSIRIIPRYEDHLWYPILVKMGGGHRIVELQGREVNAWNGYSAETKMNERIEQLALECYQAPEFDYKKFAELIVRECAEQIKTQGISASSEGYGDYEIGFNAGLFHALHTTKEHFGFGNE